MQVEKAKGPGYLHLYHRVELMVAELAADFKAGKPLRWPLLQASQVHRVWADFVRFGVVRDERALDVIFASIRDNVIRLEVATVVAEHTAVTPDVLLADHLEPAEYEAFTEWLVDFNGVARLSDYGLEPLQQAVALAYEARTPEARLKYLDRALNVVHARGDLSRLFIEGGRKSVLQLEDLADACA